MFLFNIFIVHFENVIAYDAVNMVFNVNGAANLKKVSIAIDNSKDEKW